MMRQRVKPTKLLTILAVATLPFLASCVSEAERARIAAEQAEQARIAKEAEAKRQAEEARRKAEEEKRIAAEREKQRKQALLAAREDLINLEKRVLRTRLSGEIFRAEQKLSEKERSRGRALLDAFGEDQMPILVARCKEARQVFLEAEANLNELLKALAAEGVDMEINETVLFACAEKQKPLDVLKEELKEEQEEVIPKINDIFQAAGNRWLDLATEYWYLRYKLTDFYSQFKIGAITPDELATKDAEFVEE